MNAKRKTHQRQNKIERAIAESKKQARLFTNLRNSLKSDTGRCKVILKVTTFRDIFAKKPGKWKGDGVQTCSHSIKVDKGRSFKPGKERAMKALLDKYIAEGSPKTVEITVVDKKGQRAYRPVGIAFMGKPGDLKTAATIRLDYAAAPQVYLYGNYMYNTVNSAFIESVSKYALVIQREADGKVGIIDPSVPNQFC